MEYFIGSVQHEYLHRKLALCQVSLSPLLRPKQTFTRPFVNISLPLYLHYREYRQLLLPLSYLRVEHLIILIICSDMFLHHIFLTYTLCKQDLAVYYKNRFVCMSVRAIVLWSIFFFLLGILKYEIFHRHDITD